MLLLGLLVSLCLVGACDSESDEKYQEPGTTNESISPLFKVIFSSLR